MNRPDRVPLAGYDLCEAETRQVARNFWLGIRLLPRERRRALSAVYWFSHRADDAVDGGEPGTTTPAQAERLATVRTALEATLAGTPPSLEWMALADATVRYDVPPALYHQLVEGVARDLSPDPFADWEALRAYCHGVAGVVGLIAVRIFGGAGSTVENAAAEVGHALQLTNILRDLREDAARGRWYLPVDESARFGVTRRAVAAGRAEPGFDALVAWNVERARGLYAAAPQLLRHLPRSTRACPAALVGVYRGLLEAIAAAPRATLAGRVALDPPQRIASGLSAAAAAIWR